MYSLVLQRSGGNQHSDTPCQRYRTDITRLEPMVYPKSPRKRRDGQNEDKKASHLKTTTYILTGFTFFS